MPSSAIAKTVSEPNTYGVSQYVVWFAGLLVAMLVGWGLINMQTYHSLQINGNEFHLTVAGDDASRAKGLGGKAQLAADEGMLFAFDSPGKRCIWMKDMSLSIDIVWLDSSKQVLQIAYGVTPDTYPRTFCVDDAQYVIELAAGAAERAEITVGQALSF